MQSKGSCVTIQRLTGRFEDLTKRSDYVYIDSEFISVGNGSDGQAGLSIWRLHRAGKRVYGTFHNEGDESMSELCLGTVQFGMKYGINNAIGRQPTREESFEMLEIAFRNGIRVVDTARAYGEAELILGEYLHTHAVPKDLKVISKLRPNILSEQEPDVEKVVRCEMEDSLKRIGISQLDGYLLHTPEYIYHQDILNALVKLKNEGLVRNIGVSIYNLKEGYAALDTGIVDYIQLPYSILDQRGIKEGWIHKAKQAGVTIFTRSAFLQGLLLMDTERVPEHLRNSIPYLTMVDSILKKYNVDKVSAIMEFVNQETDIDYLVFGVETKEQLTENLNTFRSLHVPKECIAELKSSIHNIEDAVILPSLWSNGKKAE